MGGRTTSLADKRVPVLQCIAAKDAIDTTTLCAKRAKEIDEALERIRDLERSLAEARNMSQSWCNATKAAQGKVAELQATVSSLRSEIHELRQKTPEEEFLDDLRQENRGLRTELDRVRRDVVFAAMGCDDE